MASDKFHPHLVILPEDDANRQIANGFLLQPALKDRAIQVLPPAGGWTKVVEKFRDDHVPAMRRYPQRRILLMIDFDDRQADRLSFIKDAIPSQIIDRTFILGALSEPENLRTEFRKSFEDIGKSLAQDCAENARTAWDHDLLKHNKDELDRMISCVKPFLFE